MKSGKLLPVIHTDSSCFLFEKDTGNPVWPVSSAAQEQLLTQVAAQYKAELQFLSPHHVQAANEKEHHLSSYVSSLTPETDTLAELYAHLTGRHVCYHHREAGIEKNIAVYIGLKRNVSSKLLQSVYTSSLDASLAPGFLFAESLEDLTLLVLKHSASLYVGLGSPVNKRVDYVPSANFEEDGVTSEQKILLDKTSSPENTRSIFLADNDLLTVNAHSDGIDAEFGKHVLCAVKDNPTANPTQPECYATSHCYRLHLPLEEALADERILHPGEIRAKVLLLGICFGLRIHSMPSFEWTLLHRFIMNPGIGTIITSWNIVFIGFANLVNLADAIAAGKDAGTAVNDFNARKEQKDLSQQFFLFGDPAFRFAATAEFDKHAVVLPNRIDNKKIVGDLWFIRSWVSDMVSKFKWAKEEEKEIIDAAGTVLNKIEYLAQLSRDIPDTWKVHAFKALHLYLHRLFYLSNGRMEWLHLNERITTGDHPAEITCTNCGELVTKYNIPLHHPSGQGRSIYNCHACGFVKDVPQQSGQVSFITREKNIVIENIPAPSHHISATLCLFSETRIANKQVLIDIDPGDPQLTFEIPGDFSLQFPRKLVLFLISDLEISILRIYGKF
jgi:predicted RNA-binding Zn-ribbon protein involved in translation (DUF1610 family)